MRECAGDNEPVDPAEWELKSKEDHGTYLEMAGLFFQQRVHDLLTAISFLLMA